MPVDTINSQMEEYGDILQKLELPPSSWATTSNELYKGPGQALLGTLAAHYYKEKYEALLGEMVLHSWELMEAMAKIKEPTVLGHKKIH